MVLRALTTNGRPIQSLYRGLTPNLMGNASSWALFFYVKSIIEKRLCNFHSNSFSGPPASLSSRPSNSSLSDGSCGSDQLTPFDYFLSSGISGLIITVATNPIWVLKTRMLSSDKGNQGAYTSMWQGASEVWKGEGLKGFYRGVGISCLGVSHGAVQFAVYEPLKKVWRRYLDHSRGLRQGLRQEKLGNTATLVISAAAKIVAGTATYPYQVVRSRLQTYDAEERFGRGIRGVVRNVWREDGMRGFYRGVGPNVVRVLPATWVTFLVYENVRFYLPLWLSTRDKESTK